MVKELKALSNWKAAISHAVEIPPHLFSFLWRFRSDWYPGLNFARSLKAFPSKDAKKLKSAYKKYQVFLRSRLTTGQIYLVPDAMVTFNNPNRQKKEYSRTVLLIDVRTNQLIFVPFSKKVAASE